MVSYLLPMFLYFYIKYLRLIIQPLHRFKCKMALLI